MNCTLFTLSSNIISSFLYNLIDYAWLAIIICAFKLHMFSLSSYFFLDTCMNCQHFATVLHFAMDTWIARSASWQLANCCMFKGVFS